MENDFEEEPPDELCDPIMGTLMENPVKLPTSGQIVDRTTIARQLLSAPMDPFNRQPLTLDQVIPFPEIKAYRPKLRYVNLCWIAENICLIIFL